MEKDSKVKKLVVSMVYCLGCVRQREEEMGWEGGTTASYLYMKRSKGEATGFLFIIINIILVAPVFIPLHHAALFGGPLIDIICVMSKNNGKIKSGNKIGEVPGLSERGRSRSSRSTVEIL